MSKCKHLLRAWAALRLHTLWPLCQLAWLPMSGKGLKSTSVQYKTMVLFQTVSEWSHSLMMWPAITRSFFQPLAMLSCYAMIFNLSTRFSPEIVLTHRVTRKESRDEMCHQPLKFNNQHRSHKWRRPTSVINKILLSNQHHHWSICLFILVPGLKFCRTLVSDFESLGLSAWQSWAALAALAQTRRIIKFDPSPEAPNSETISWTRVCTW